MSPGAPGMATIAGSRASVKASPIITAKCSASKIRVPACFRVSSALISRAPTMKR